MWIGFKALAEKYGIELAQPFQQLSSLGSARATLVKDGYLENLYPSKYLPSDSFQGHFEFGLKYEPVHLEFFARLFAATGPEPIERWCRSAPYGRYSRRTGFLFEWLTGTRLDIPDVDNGGYCDAIPADDYLVSTTSQRVRRWRVNNNLPGTREFCPLVRATPEIASALAFDIESELKAVQQQFDDVTLIRCANWLTFKETRSSFLIERESDQDVRIRRFAQVMTKYCGRIDQPLEDKSLRLLQEAILGDNALGLGLRRSPVYVGQTTLQEEVVHYIAPHFDQVPDLLDGLQAFEYLTRSGNPIARAAVLAFGFVYIHPMRDGNGRIHRFLINDTLVRDGVVPKGFILPVSASITSSSTYRKNYDLALESFSSPLLDRYGASYHLGPIIAYEDGSRSNFVFTDYEDASFAWRFPDLTNQVVFTARLIEHTIRTLIVDETRKLITFSRAQRHLKDVLEMPDQDAARIIRSVFQNNWSVSGKLRKAYPALSDSELASSVVQAIRSVMDDESDDGQSP